VFVFSRRLSKPLPHPMSTVSNPSGCCGLSPAQRVNLSEAALVYTDGTFSAAQTSSQEQAQWHFDTLQATQWAYWLLWTPTIPTAQGTSNGGMCVHVYTCVLCRGYIRLQNYSKKRFVAPLKSNSCYCYTKKTDFDNNSDFPLV